MFWHCVVLTLNSTKRKEILMRKYLIATSILICLGGCAMDKVCPHKFMIYYNVIEKNGDKVLGLTEVAICGYCKEITGSKSIKAK